MIKSSLKTVLMIAPLLVFLWVLYSSFSFSGRPDAGQTTDPDTDCRIHDGPCTRTIGEQTVSLEILPRPVRAMTDLTFRVTFSGPPVEMQSPEQYPWIDLNMPDMDMGYNRVHLTPVRDGVFEGTGVFVRCPTGIPLWQATLTVPGAGETEFRFHVVY